MKLLDFGIIFAVLAVAVVCFLVIMKKGKGCGGCSGCGCAEKCTKKETNTSAD